MQVHVKNTHEGDRIRRCDCSMEGSKFISSIVVMCYQNRNDKGSYKCCVIPAKERCGNEEVESGPIPKPDNFFVKTRSAQQPYEMGDGQNKRSKRENFSKQGK